MAISSIQVAVSLCKKAIKHVFFFSIAVNVLNMFVPLYTLQVLDRVANSGNMNTLFLLTLITVCALTVLTIVEGSRRFVLVRVGEWLEKELSHHLIIGGFVLGVAQPRFSNAQIMRDLGTIKSFISGNVCVSIFDAPWSILFFVCVCIINKAIGVVALIGVIVLIAFAFISDAATTRILSKINEGHSKNLQDLDMASRNAETIEAMGMGRRIAENWFRRHKIISDLNKLASSRSNIIMLLIKYIRMLLQVAVYCAGIVYALNTGGTVGGVIACSILMGKVFAPFESFVSTWKALVNTRVAYNRLIAIQNAIPSIEEQKYSITDSKGAIRAENLVTMYSSTRQVVLKNVSFHLQPGETMCIIGPNAAGKTTLLKAIIGLLTPIGGMVTIDGMEAHKLDRETLGQYVGFVGQDSEFFEATIRDNIARMMQNPAPEQVFEAARLAGAHEMILTMPRGYDTIVGGQTGVILSSGQKQKLSLARALFGDIRILVLDEPNSNMDRDGEKRLANIMAWAKGNNITTLFTTHRMQMVAAADKILILQNGTVVNYGTRDEVMTNVQKMAAA